MKLYTASTSPFVRKVSIVVAELGLGSRIKQEPVVVSPVSRNEGVARDNPLVKIPTLVLDDGSTLFDSPVICEYLDNLNATPRFFPASGPARWSALRRQALADGLMDAAVLLRYEQVLRPEPLRWVDWMAGQQHKVTNAIDALEADAASFGDGFDIGHVAAACACGYLDFRFAHLNWRDGHPGLTAWFAKVSERPSVIASVPH